MNDLWLLDISNTDINEGVEYLPKNLVNIWYSTKERPDCKLIALVSRLVEFSKYGQCHNCKEINTSKNWCQPCAEKEWKEDLEHLMGQEAVEKFNTRKPHVYDKLQWISYEQFTDVEYLAEGGFSKIYKAYLKEKVTKQRNDKKYRWEKVVNEANVVLKVINNSQNITLEFLTEITNTKLVDRDDRIATCYGISQEPITKNYVIVMEYKKDGNLRNYLKNNYKKLSWKDKLYKLKNVAWGLNKVHKQNLVHCDFHSGNILNDGLVSYITDLGLSKSANIPKEERKILGVLPYVAPEVLRGQPYTQVSDVYSFGIVAYELLVGVPPYYNREHDTSLALQVCNGLRPTFNIKIPFMLEELIKRCWDTNPEKRLSAEELYRTLDNWHDEIINNKNTEFTQQLQEAEEYNKALPTEIRFPKYEIHSGAFYTSKPINTKQITELLKTTSESLVFDFTKSDNNTQTKEVSGSLTKEIENLSVRTKRQLSISSQSEPLPHSKSTKMTGLLERINIDETQKFQSEPIEIDDNSQNQDWRNIHLNFTEEIVQNWQNLNFTYSQTQDWINIGLQPTDYNLASWLRDTKYLTPEKVLNHSNLEQLNQEFFNWWQEQQQTQIEIPPKS